MGDEIEDLARSTELEIVSVLLNLATGVRARLSDVFETRGMSWPRYEVLAYVCRTGPVPYSAIARDLVRHRTSVTATVGALEDAGFVSRRTNPRMPQQFLVEVTDSGQRMVRRADDALRRVRPHMAVPADGESLLRTLRDLEQHWTVRGAPAGGRTPR